MPPGVGTYFFQSKTIQNKIKNDENKHIIDNETKMQNKEERVDTYPPNT